MISTTHDLAVVRHLSRSVLEPDPAKQAQQRGERRRSLQPQRARIGAVAYPSPTQKRT